MNRAMMRYVLLAAFEVDVAVQISRRECGALSMTVKGGLCDGMKAPEKLCGVDFFFPGGSATSVRTVEPSVHDECCCT
jgi:hypothetical protein